MARVFNQILEEHVVDNPKLKKMLIVSWRMLKGIYNLLLLAYGMRKAESISGIVLVHSAFFFSDFLC